MKTTIKLLFSVLCLVSFSEAQWVGRSADGAIRGAYSHPIVASARAYAANTIDTLGSTASSAINLWYARSATQKYLDIGPAGLIVAEFTVNDSMTADVYFDSYDATAAAYVAEYADSIIITGAAKSEILLRTSTLDRWDAYNKPMRIRLSIRNVTQGTTSATYTLRVLWKENL